MEKGGVSPRLHSAIGESRERAWKRRETPGKSGAPQKARERKVEEAKGKRRLFDFPPPSPGCIRHRFQITGKRVGVSALLTNS